MTVSLKQSLVLAMLAVVTIGTAGAGPLRDRLAERRAERQQHQQQQEPAGDDLQDDGDTGTMARTPAGVQVLRDVVYGQDPRQRFDVYLPSQARNAPVIFMVHGGGWRRGDKAASTVIENKVARWVPRGFIVISTNYRMLPDAKPIEQARDVGRALGTAQKKAAEWGGDAGKFILMGHSAGAHLVSLLAVSPGMAAHEGARPWLGTIPLDSGGYDIVDVMDGRHFSLYDDAFGTSPEYWRRASPYHQINQAAQPVLAVCSTRRAVACPQAHAFVTRAKSFGTQASVLEKAMTHKEINEQLGADPAYTAEVESFMRQLDPAVAAALASRAP